MVNFPAAQVTEHHVQFAFRHFLKPGDVVYDVGANRGWLTVPLSRLVGVRGYVAGFEASARNIKILSQAVRDNHLTNVHVIGAAVFHTSGITVNLYENAFSNTDSIYFSDETSRTAPVQTVSLDDYYKMTGLKPALLKMDIEGAEYDALLGATRLLEDCRPILILEIRKTDLRPFRFLRDQEYHAFNLKTFVEFTDENAFADTALVEDYLFIHHSDLERGNSQFLARSVTAFSAIAVDVEIEDRATYIRQLPVAPGLNCFRLKCSAQLRQKIEFQVLKGARCVVDFAGGYYLVGVPYLSFVVYASDLGVIDAIICTETGDPVRVNEVESSTIALSEADHQHHRILEIVTPFGLTADSLSRVLDEAVNMSSPTRLDIYLSHLAQAEPNHPKVLYLAGVHALHKDRPDEAESLLYRAAEAGFDVHWSNIMRATALLRLGRLGEAREAADRASKANANNPALATLLEEMDKREPKR